MRRWRIRPPRPRYVLARRAPRIRGGAIINIVPFGTLPPQSAPQCKVIHSITHASQSPACARYSHTLSPSACTTTSGNSSLNNSRLYIYKHENTALRYIITDEHQRSKIPPPQKARGRVRAQMRAKQFNALRTDFKAIS